LAKSDSHVARVRTLVDRLLDVTRMTSGQLPLSLASVDLREIVAGVIDRMRETFERAGSETRLTGDAVVGLWDSAAIETVATDLLLNAAKYGRGQPIDVLVRRDADHAVLEVKDHGIGVAEEDRLRIFGRFERAVPVANYGGFGIGLWVVQRVVDAHGGSIEVEGAVGVGATFRVRLPLVPGARGETDAS
jgi:signal transduction histidine kinase